METLQGQMLGAVIGLNDDGDNAPFIPDPWILEGCVWNDEGTWQNKQWCPLLEGQPESGVVNEVIL